MDAIEQSGAPTAPDAIPVGMSVSPGVQAQLDAAATTQPHVDVFSGEAINPMQYNFGDISHDSEMPAGFRKLTIAELAETQQALAAHGIPVGLANGLIARYSTHVKQGQLDAGKRELARASMQSELTRRHGEERGKQMLADAHAEFDALAARLQWLRPVALATGWGVDPFVIESLANMAQARRSK